MLQKEHHQQNQLQRDEDGTLPPSATEPTKAVEKRKGQQQTAHTALADDSTKVSNTC
jgi:hypothetical protein